MNHNPVFVFPASGSITGSVMNFAGFTGSFTSSAIYDVTQFSSILVQTIGTGTLTLQQTNIDLVSQNNLPANAKIWNPLLTVNANTSSLSTPLQGAYLRYMATGSVQGWGIVDE